MDKYLQQTFEINNLKIRVITNAGVLKIGTAGMIRRTTPSIYGQYVSLSGITYGTLPPAVPMQTPVRAISRGS